MRGRSGDSQRPGEEQEEQEEGDGMSGTIIYTHTNNLTSLK